MRTEQGDAMTTKTEFNAEEWETLTQAPILSALQVVAAQRGGTIRETLAVGRTYADARKHSGESPRVGEIGASPPSLGADRLRAMQGQVNSHADSGRAQALRLLEGKAAPEEI